MRRRDAADTRAKYGRGTLVQVTCSPSISSGGWTAPRRSDGGEIYLASAAAPAIKTAPLARCFRDCGQPSRGLEARTMHESLACLVLGEPDRGAGFIYPGRLLCRVAEERNRMGQEQVRILIVEAASFMTMGPAHNPSPHLLGRASPASHCPPSPSQTRSPPLDSKQTLSRPHKTLTSIVWE